MFRKGFDTRSCECPLGGLKEACETFGARGPAVVESVISMRPAGIPGTGLRQDWTDWDRTRPAGPVPRLRDCRRSLLRSSVGASIRQTEPVRAEGRRADRAGVPNVSIKQLVQEGSVGGHALARGRGTRRHQEPSKQVLGGSGPRLTAISDRSRHACLHVLRRCYISAWISKLSKLTRVDRKLIRGDHRYVLRDVANTLRSSQHGAASARRMAWPRRAVFWSSSRRNVSSCRSRRRKTPSSYANH